VLTKRNRFLNLRWLAVLVLLAVPFAHAESTFLKPEDVAWDTILTGPPASGSEVEKEEIAKLLEWQNKRTPSDVARCKAEEKPDPFIFSDVLGDKFAEVSLPVTARLLNDAAGDVKVFTKLAKAKWERKRPPYVDDRIKPCVPMEENGSYPSAHATRGVVWSIILGEIFPDKKDQLLARGKLIGEDRVIAGIHFPSDVAAGQSLGQAIAEKMLKDPAFQTALAQAKDECVKAQIGN
jgi:acid phosphatase (class A)